MLNTIKFVFELSDLVTNGRFILSPCRKISFAVQEHLWIKHCVITLMVKPCIGNKRVNQHFFLFFSKSLPAFLFLSWNIFLSLCFSNNTSSPCSASRSTSCRNRWRLDRTWLSKLIGWELRRRLIQKSINNIVRPWYIFIRTKITRWYTVCKELPVVGVKSFKRICIKVHFQPEKSTSIQNFNRNSMKCVNLSKLYYLVHFVFLSKGE